MRMITTLPEENGDNTLPLWAKRLGRSTPFSSPAKWPATPAEGLRLSIQLSDFGHRQLIASTRSEHPHESTDSVAKLAYETLSAWEHVRSSLRLAPRNSSHGLY